MMIKQQFEELTSDIEQISENVFIKENYIFNNIM